jgi:hypothetical protein
MTVDRTYESPADFCLPRAARNHKRLSERVKEDTREYSFEKGKVVSNTIGELLMIAPILLRMAKHDME